MADQELLKMEEIMTKKLTISIPDDLHKRLDKYRSRIAISTICAEAINTEIESIDDCLKAVKGRFRLLTQREICSLAHKEGRHWAGYKATLEDLAIVSCWRGPDEEEPDWFDKLSEDAKEKIEKETDSWTTVEELAIDLISEVVKIRSDEDGFDFYRENHEAAQEFIRGAQEIWWMIEDEAIELLTSSKRNFQGKE